MVEVINMQDNLGDRKIFEVNLRNWRAVGRVERQGYSGDL